MKLKSILFIVTSHKDIDENIKTGVWFEEFAIPFNMFKEQGFELSVSSINGGEIPIDPNSKPSEVESIKFIDAINALKNSEKLSDLDLDWYDGVFIPGGHGAMFDLAVNKDVKNALAYFANHERPIASVCHGPAALIDVKLEDGSYLVEGRKVTSFTNKEENETKLKDKMPFLLQTKLLEQGGIFIEDSNWSNHIEISLDLITGQNPQSTKSVAKALISHLLYVEKIAI